LLVSLRTSIRGNVKYFKTTTEAEHRTETGEARAAWETTRTIANPEEDSRARVARSKAATLIRGVCVESAFGLLCPLAKRAELESAIREARAVTATFNRTAELSRIDVNIITGEIAADDVEAVKSINSEIRGLLESMARGVAALDVSAIRDAADRARSIGQMLSPVAQERVKIAVDTARAAARRIVKAGETAAIEIDAAAVAKITSARTAFLDLDETEAEAEPFSVAIPEAAPARALDLFAEEGPALAL
jgi:hypothetical protein